jgi:uncharacterized radical SAM superfamily protein
MLNKELKKIIHSVSLDTYTDEEIVEKVFDSYYKIIKDKMQNLDPLDYSTFPIVQLPVIGKLYVSNLRVRRINEAREKAYNDGVKPIWKRDN